MRPLLPPLDDLEARRLRLQADLDGRRRLADRNRMGQFATPTALARQVVGLGLSHLDEPEVRFLDPAFGTGSFYAALAWCLADRDPPPLTQALGVEFDPHYGDPARALWRDHALELRQGDFTLLPPEPRFNLLIANPPYVRHHHILRADKERLVARSSALIGGRISGLAGLYVHFMVHALPWMAPGGVAVWLVPSEFMDVGYGAPLRRWLCDRVTLLRVHRFDPASSAFDDALVSSAVVVLRNRPPQPGHTVSLAFGGTLERPGQETQIPAERLRGCAKWTWATSPPAGPAPVRLGDLFRVQRGLATGGNRFFILTADRAAALGLPPEVLRPILPSPRDLPTDEVASDADGLPTDIPGRFLLDCRLTEEEVSRHPALHAYLQTGADTVSEGYLCSRRSPWYAQERREPAPILCTYMGRSRDDRPPFRFIRNRSRAVCGNVYLMLYPRRLLSEQALDAIWQHLRDLPAELLVREGRVYGGGLHKLEPRELMEVGVPADGAEKLPQGLRKTDT